MVYNISYTNLYQVVVVLLRLMESKLHDPTTMTHRYQLFLIGVND